MASDESDKALPSPKSTANHPPYPEMIIAAITTLSEKGGSSKAAISKYMEANYKDLPAGHSTLLSHHLNRLKENEELLMVKHSYMLPSPNSDSTAVPEKRGRGRPPKPKDPAAPAPEPAVAGPKRGRGRPPKPKDPAALVVEAAKSYSRPAKKGGSAGSGRPRGRPPKAKPAWPAVGAE